MAEPDRDHTPAALPLYLRVATALRDDLDHQRIQPGSRLPSERTLADRFRVNRQTVRSALQFLREQSLVVTDRRGTFAAVAAPPPPAAPADGRHPSFPGGSVATGALVRAGLRWQHAPYETALALDLPPSEPTLVHRHLVLDARGDVVQRTLTHFSHHALEEIPELGRYRRGKDCEQQPDLRLLYHWMHRAGLRPVRRESIGASEHCAPDQVQLTVHREVADQHGHLLELTELHFAPQTAAWRYEFSG
ncbi:GntR family transcriptional regulator [Streptomyces sp. NPDC001941]|uniref:GntR family transcriptional regulator n=1 Tax=Streptomyces sp. NPDC001941 TaxID=3154659 RepID=UPI00331C47B6